MLLPSLEDDGFMIFRTVNVSVFKNWSLTLWPSFLMQRGVCSWADRKIKKFYWERAAVSGRCNPHNNNSTIRQPAVLGSLRPVAGVSWLTFTNCSSGESFVRTCGKVITFILLFSTIIIHTFIYTRNMVKHIKLLLFGESSFQPFCRLLAASKLLHMASIHVQTDKHIYYLTHAN